MSRVNSILGELKTTLLMEAAAKAMAAAPGDLAEFGVYKGGVLRQLADLAPDRTVWGYDTFEGLPAIDWDPDNEKHNPGDFADVDLKEVIGVLTPYPNICLVVGYFPATAVEARYCFAHLDFDFYAGTKAALEWLLPRMNPGGAIVLDDFDWPYCPGVRRAVDELGLPYQKLMEYQAVIYR